MKNISRIWESLLRVHPLAGGHTGPPLQTINYPNERNLRALRKASCHLEQSEESYCFW
jgi:hypothetical protein